MALKKGDGAISFAGVSFVVAEWFGGDFADVRSYCRIQRAFPIFPCAVSEVASYSDKASRDLSRTVVVDGSDFGVHD
jgi:hypothetical protein